MENNNTDEFTPRIYQLDLYEAALKENAIIYLPAGAGKTFIAIMLIKELSADIRKLWLEGAKRTIFIVNTVPLVIQQSKYIKRLTGLSCAAISNKVDSWNETEWTKKLIENQVFVMTPQVLLDALSNGYMLLNRINLLIFDECHRAVKDHPMKQIMKLFKNYPKEEQPKVLGLTASLLNSNVKLSSIESIIQSLEKTLHAKIVTANTLHQIQNYYPTPKETIVQYDEYTITEIGERINSIIEEVDKIVESVLLNSSLSHIESSNTFKPSTVNKKLKTILRDIVEHLSQADKAVGIYGMSKCVLLHLIQLECIKKYTEDTETAFLLDYFISEFIKIRKLLEHEMKDVTEKERIHKYSSDQVQKLFSILKDFNTNKFDDQKFCCIIFVERRITAKVLYQILKNLCFYDDEYKFIQPEFLVGSSHDPLKNSKESLCISKWNREVLQRFKAGLSNCILATDINDEGIDVPLCTLVVRYSFPTDVKAYVQSKGRARFATSQYTLLMKKNDLNHLNRYEDFKTTELHLRKMLIGQTTYQLKPTEGDTQNKLYKDSIEPYNVIDETGVVISVITEQSAISLINNYCASLLNSKFVYLSPTWIKYEVKNGSEKVYQISLKLPIVSPLKSVILGDPMTSIELAKRSAAMKTCITLYEIGELSNRLTPNTPDAIIRNVDYLFPNWVEENKSELPVVGTYKKKRRHKLQFPSALYGAFPLPNKPMYLHLIRVKPTYSAPHDDNRHLVFYNLLYNDAGFAILSAKKMPEIPGFPIFMNVGELHVEVQINYAEMNLSLNKISSIKKFHTLIFNQIVPVIKSFMVFDNYNLDNCFLIAPVDENAQINWKAIDQYRTIKRVEPADPFRFKYSDYELGLVVPNYRASADIYVVTQICEDLTPSSCFPTENFFTYADYYKQKHGLIIKDLKQPMLEAKPISKKINCIKPRSMHTEIRKRKNADSGKDLKEHLVPELCIRIQFPAVYWLKATMLPYILHRISQLLVAEDLRSTIATEANLGSLSNNNKWHPLKITDEEKEESFEPLMEISIDDNIENLPLEPMLNGLEIDVLNTEANHYPWSKDQEPPDVYKNIEQIQMIQIEHYCQFMSGTYSKAADPMRHTKINFINRLSMSGPDLKILYLDKSCGPDPIQIMYALTSKLGHDAFDLERLETLGDSYLKFIASLFLYNTFPKCSESLLSALKGKIIGDRNLFYCGEKKHIPGRIKVDEFVPFSNFIPPAYTAFRELQNLLIENEISPNVLYEIQIPQEEQFAGRVSENTKDIMQEKVLDWDTAESQTGIEHHLGMQTVSDKTVADCVEALIGVYLTSMGMRHAMTLIQWFEILPGEINVDVLLDSKPENILLSEGNVDNFIPWASEIETKLGYKFNDRAYLLQAFTHPSYTANNITECYQRLVFLGNAILDFLITCYIYEHCGNLNAGALTDLRSALVNNITFACLTVRHGLHTALLAYSPKLNDAINRFVKFQVERNHAINDELLWILLEENECHMAEYVDVPKVLGDIFESTIGAIYLDCNKNLVKVWELIYCFMHKEFDEFSKNIPKQPIRVLYETQGARPQFANAITVENKDSVIVPLKVNIAGKTKLFHGFGANKEQAKCAAAKQALKSLLHTP